MKDSNVIVALNRVLTEYFGHPCIFQNFKAEVGIDEHPQMGVVQGMYSGRMVFYCAVDLSLEYTRENSFYIYSTQLIGGNFKHCAYLLRGSGLRKKLLKKMLKHNV
jgi:hypothetical protein